MKKRIVKKLIAILKWCLATRFRRIVSALTIISLVAGPISYIVFKPQAAEAAWWNDSWQYRKPIPITNDTAAQNAVYIPITIDTSDTTRFNADCGDLRFTNIAGELLSYYIVSGCGTASTVVNVYFDNLIAGASTVYYYYGNPIASLGASLIDFTTVASSYTVGSIGVEEKGTGPVAYWSFDEGFGTATNDETANKNIGTMTNMSSTASSTSGWQTEEKCVSGKCLAFDGVNDYVDCGDGSSFNITGSITLSAWINLKNWEPTWTSLKIIDKGLPSGDPNNDAYFLQINNTAGTITLMGEDDDGDNWWLTTSDSISLNQWYYIVGVRDGSNLYIYINGVLSKSGTTAVNMSTNSQNVVIGAYSGQIPNNVQYRFNGLIDEVKIYSYARSASQIKMDYNAGLAGTSGRAAAEGVAISAGSRSAQWLSNGLVGWWKMDEAYGTWNGTAGEVVDWSGNRKSGTAAGTEGGTASTTAGKFGNAGSFDGTDDYVYAPTAWSGRTSLSYWIKFDSLGAQAIISPCAYTSCDFSTGNHRRGNTLLLSTNKLQLTRSTYIDGCSWNGITVNSNKDDFQAGEWYHIVETWDSKDDHIARVYINGELDNSAPVTHSCRWDIPHYYLGRGSSSQGQLNGFMDDVRVYNRVLSDREVRDLYNYAPGPVAHWKMEQGSGQYAYDTSGNSNTGTLGSGATADSADPVWTTGKIGKALKFDGVNDYVNAGNAASLQIGGSGKSFTLEVWAKRDVNQANMFIVGQGTASTNYGLHFGYRYTNHFCLAFYANDLDVPTLYLDAGEWHHWVATYDGVTNERCIYRDGSLEICATASEDYLGSGILYIGRALQPGYFNGSIDDVRIYNYVRTAEQIIEDMGGRGVTAEGGGATAAVSASGKTNVAYWKFDEGFGATAYDSSPNKINGAISGAATSTSSGKFGKALVMNGTTGVVTITNTAAIDLNNNLADGFTISTWINPASAGENNNGQIFWKGANNYLRVGNLSGSRLDLGAGVDLATDIAATSTSAVAVGSWSHIVMTYASSTQKVQIYVDGVLKTTSSAGVGPTAAESNNLLIGGATTNNFDGLIDEFKIYSFVLTEDDIKTEYNKGASLKLGSFSTSSSGVASSSAASIYCVPGSTDPCSPPVGEWKFEEGSGQSAQDTSGNGNTGTLTNGPTWATGKIGKALKFDGVNDYVNAGNSDIFNFTGDSFTISAWVKTTVYTSSNRGIVGKANGWPTYYGIGFNLYQGGTRISYRSDNGGVETSVSSNKWNDGNFHHVVLVINKNTNYAYAYLDGALDGSLDISGVIGSIDSSNPLVIGAWRGSSNWWDGTIDDVKIYNYARTSAQIAWDYNRGAPAGWWKMDECQGSAIHDSSNFGNIGALYIGAGGTQTATGTCALAGSMWGNGAAGKRNASLNFDGTDDYVDEPTSISNVQSVGFWAYPSTASQSFLQLSSTATITSSNGTVSAGAGFASPAVYVNGKAGATIFAGTWNHIVVTTGTGITANAIKFGLVGSTYYSGKIDDVQIFNYALTPVQIKTLYNGGAVRF